MEASASGPLGWDVSINDFFCAVQGAGNGLPDVGGHKVRPQVLGNSSQSGIEYESDLQAVLVMISNETKGGLPALRNL